MAPVTGSGEPTVPFDGYSDTNTVDRSIGGAPAAAKSLPSTSIKIGTPETALTLSFVAVASGGGGPTVIVTVAAVDFNPVMSATRYLNVTTPPAKPAAGVNVITPLTGGEIVPTDAGGG